jgi:hypothetical protein
MGINKVTWYIINGQIDGSMMDEIKQNNYDVNNLWKGILADSVGSCRS